MMRITFVEIDHEIFFYGHSPPSAVPKRQVVKMSGKSLTKECALGLVNCLEELYLRRNNVRRYLIALKMTPIY